MDLLRRILFAAFVVGLGLSITLSEATLTALTALWLWRLRDPDVRSAQAWPLRAPVLVFAAATLLSALLSGAAGRSLLASKGLLLMAALFVTADALDDVRGAQGFLTFLSACAAIAAGIGLLQVAVCPGPAVDTGSPAWLYHRCFRPAALQHLHDAGRYPDPHAARDPAAAPAGAPRRPWFLPLWLVMLGGLVATYTRGAWLGFAAGILALLPGAGGVASFSWPVSPCSSWVCSRGRPAFVIAS